ncbi:hypothetical protein AMS68_000782 [Peltaster fructicola]|uniref:ABC transporter domain-containing protein n=1 Tax=Peltaster fructicola TaxID=286661 RepID=A0A6H0XKW6_9PEZI|nr:hypothetical protein AMS68_000782 [Peltaster fructicola]
MALAMQMPLLQRRCSGSLLQPIEVIRFAQIALHAACCAQSLYFQFRAVPLKARENKENTAQPKDEKTDEEDPFEESEADREQRLQRLKESGNWLTFIKPYKMFIPMLWPFANIKLQICIAFLVLHLMVSRIFGILVPRQLGIITDKLAAGAGKGELPWRDVAIWGVLSFCESELFVTLRDMAFTPVQQYAYKSISTTAFSHVMNLSMDFHNDKSSSDLIRIVDQGHGLSDILSFVCFELAPLLADITIAIAYVTSTFDAYMVLIMVSGGIVYGWLGLESSKWSVNARRKYNLAMCKSSEAQFEGLSNWQTVTQFNRNQYEADRYVEELNKYCKAENEMDMANRGINTLQTSVLTGARLVATALAMYRVSQGEIPLGQLVTFTAVWSTVMNPITSLTWMMRRVQSMLTDSERLLVLLQTKPSVTSKPTAHALDLKAGEVVFDKVDFSYDPRKSTLSHVSFVAKPGMTVALVGQTGGGKSTLMKLLYRYYDISGGSIQIDGQDIRDVTLDSLRDSFGLVPQDPALFNTTLIENLRYAKLDATDEDIAEACRAACIHDKIMQFPDKYNSKVGERGVKLSGGEMQRIAIARAILRNPKIVLLDEATSMIDAETEAEIQKALRRLTAGRTTFVVAHRLSTIQHADLILVIEDGQIVERGNHEELFRQNGKYVSLWSKQMSKTLQLIPTLVQSGASTPPTSTDGDSSEGESTEPLTRRKTLTAKDV